MNYYVDQDVRLTDSLERELMAQAIAEQQGYNLIADLKGLFKKVTSYLGGIETTTAKPASSSASHAA